jgi:FMN phosphatase YigB (HAD superfamily)
LKIGNFDKYFKEIFVSEDVGIPKPATEFFDYCFEKLDNPDKASVILIGDSLSADIKGGYNYGLETIWFNKSNDDMPEDITPTYIVTKLSDIEKIL